MKNIQKIASILFLTIIYCLSISMNVAPHIDDSTQSPISLSQKEVHQKVIPGNQNTVDVQIHFDNSLEKPNVNKPLKAIISRTESSFSEEVKNCFLQSNNVAIRFRKTDYIFPFHYFW